MILSIPISNFDENHLYFSDIIKNIVISNSTFIRLYYSTKHLTTNGVFISFPLNVCSFEKAYNKVKCNFKIKFNQNVVNLLINIEKDIIKKIDNNNNSEPVFSIKEQLEQEFIKLYNVTNYNNNSVITLVCKISGIWNNDTNYGLTSKFYPVVKYDHSLPESFK
tara:strand:+ start:1130 stop:1621 length:492 start_codon:yes stop_codon:yes gene_type:complete